MPRISKTDHPAILRMVDQEHRKVADVAAEFGCTAANIYALLAKLRRDTPAALPQLVATPVTAAPPEPPTAVDLFAAPIPSPPAVAAPPEPREPTSVTPLARIGGARRAGIGAAQAKPGVGLLMRTAEGEENVTPFRSLDDLLSAVKPILRAAARSPDAVWFCIQPLDLATLDSDAA